MINNFLKFLKLIRVHHYVKNLIIFLPLLLQLDLLILEYKLFFYGFLSFCFVASAGYLINDIHDVNFDKLHPLKKDRPIAKNEISILSAYITSFLFLTLSFYTAFLISISFFYYIFIYFSYSIIYTFFLKKISIIDIIFLSAFYCIRIFSGAEILNQSISTWLIFFSFIFFSYLCSAKRLVDLNSSNKSLYYEKADHQLLKVIAPILMLMSILIFFSYLVFNAQLIHSVIIGYSIILILVVWNFYLLKKIFRNEINVDIVIFVLKDKVTYIFIFLFLIILGFNFQLQIR